MASKFAEKKCGPLPLDLVLVLVLVLSVPAFMCFEADNTSSI